MDVKYLIPFIEAAFEVLKAEAGIKMNRGALSLAKGPYMTDDVTVAISLVGDIVGTVFYSMDIETALKTVSGILGEHFKEFDALAQSGIAELGNVITGRASVKLSQTGFESTISPPTLLIGKDAMLSTLDIPRLIVPLESPMGSMVIHLAITQSSLKGMKSADLVIPDAPEVM